MLFKKTKIYFLDTETSNETRCLTLIRIFGIIIYKFKSKQT